VADSSLFAANGAIAQAAPWLEAFRKAGHGLGEAAAWGLLDRGIRAILTHVLIFQWNRLGLTASSQGILAHAARSALLPHG
jgi:thiopeptide-type bacteriocin biosynthesis protein